MEFRARNDHTIATRLTRSDMEKLNMTFEAMDYADADTRRAIHTLLENACRELHMTPNTNGRLIIEAFAEHDGGCRIVFTLPPEHGRLRLLIKRRAQPVLFAFDEVNELLDACAALCECPESDLYQCEGRYYLLLPCGSREKSACAVLDEYGRGLGTDAIRIQYVREHGRLLIARAAARRLSNLC